MPSGRQLSNDNKFSNRDLVSVDSSNQLIIWDVLRGQTLFSFIHPDSSRQILDMRLPAGCDNWVQHKLYLLYTGNLFVLFDHGNCTFQEIPIVSKRLNNADTISSECYVRFALDYQHCSGSTSCICFATSDSSNYDSISCVSLCKSWDYANDSQITIHERVPLLKPSNNIPQSSSRGNLSMSTSPSLQSLPDVQPNEGKPKRPMSSSSSIRKLMSDIIVGPDSNPNTMQNTVSNLYVFIDFHEGLRDFIVVGNESDIFLVNIRFGVLVHTFNVDKGASQIVSTFCTKSRPCVFTLHENGTLFLRKYVMSGEHNVSIQFETLCSNENPRFTNKKTQVLACIVDPFSESKILVHLSDGRILRYELVAPACQPSNFLEQKHVNTPSTPCIRSSVVWEEPKEQKTHTKDGSTKKITELNEIVAQFGHSEVETTAKIKLTRITNSLGQLTCLKAMNNVLVAGNTLGFLIVMSLNEDIVKIEKKFAIHSNSPVSGIEFISENKLLCFSNTHFSTNPRCELIMTELQTGDFKVLKTDDNFHIQAISISPLKQYFVIVYKVSKVACCILC